MEFFSNTNAVKLKSHINKFLVADDDRRSTRQSRTGNSRWLVEIVDANRHHIRLKSCYNRYLTASTDPFLLGMTGRKVLQTLPENPFADETILWRPIRDGFQVKLITCEGTYLRANGGTPPWRNSVTHDSPIAGAAQNFWILWDVEALELPEDEAVEDYMLTMPRSLPISNEMSTSDCDDQQSTVSFSSWLFHTEAPPPAANRRSSAEFSTPMDLFRHARTVRLKSVHDKYLIAADDDVSVAQDRDGSSKSAVWIVESLEDSFIRLKSCYGKYLTASNQPFLLGMTGHKVLQTVPPRLDSSVVWEPIRENGAVKLRTGHGNFLRANGGLPPWRNSITHDTPHRTATKDWIYWEVHVVDILTTQVKPAAAPLPAAIAIKREDSFASESDSPMKVLSLKSASFSRQEANDSLSSFPSKGNEGRLINYRIANEFGEVDTGFEELCITFKGSEVNELAWRLEEELGIEGITVCTRSPLNGKLYPLRLQLPPNNATMHVIVIPPSSTDKAEAAA